MLINDEQQIWGRADLRDMWSSLGAPKKSRPEKAG